MNEEWSNVPLPEKRDDANVLRPEVVIKDNYDSRIMFGADIGGVLALALAIASWIVLPIIGAIAALIIAPGAIHRIHQANGELGGTGIVRAAQIIAVVNLVVCALIAWLIVISVHAAVHSFGMGLIAPL